MINQAFVLAAGLGMRLRPLTEDLPKPLIPIFQKPLITFVLDHLIAAGVKSFVVNTHHRSEALRDFFSDGNYREHRVQLADELFISYSGDVLTDIDVSLLVDEHFRAGNDVTLALRETHLGKDVAIEGNRVVDIASRYGHEGRYDFAGVGIWTRAVFERIPPRQHISYISVLADWIGEGGKIGGLVLNDGKWFNIGSRREYLAIHRAIADDNWKPAFVGEANWPICLAPDAQIDSTARLSGFYSIGAGCQVGAGAAIEDTILLPGAQIASRSHLRNCIVRSQRKAEGDLIDTDI
jgi:mannose-1-phosphate guanylyltransferase